MRDEIPDLGIGGVRSGTCVGKSLLMHVYLGLVHRHSVL